MMSSAWFRFGSIGVALLVGVLTIAFLRARPYDEAVAWDVASEERGDVASEERGFVRVSDLVPVVADAEGDARSLATTPHKLVDVSTELPDTIAGLPDFERTRHLVVVGIDRKPWEKRGGLADTIVFVAFDEESGQVGLLSIPRDLYVDFGGGHAGRINSAVLASVRGERTRVEFVGLVIGNLLGLPVHHVVIVDLTVLETAVDALGGVEVVVPCPLRDDFVDPRSETGRRVIDVPAGRVHMSGLTAALYARSRHGRTDWDRARRQQAILIGLRDRLASASGLAILPELLDALPGHVETNLTRLELLELAALAARLDAVEIHGQVLGSAATEAFRTAEGQAVLLPRPERVRDAVTSLFRAPAPGTPLPTSICRERDAALRSKPRGAPGASP